jgi:hypothetical protein
MQLDAKVYVSHFVFCVWTEQIQFDMPKDENLMCKVQLTIRIEWILIML